MDYLNRNRKHFFEIGLIFALVASLTALEWKTKIDKVKSTSPKIEHDESDEPTIITVRKKPELQASTKINTNNIAIVDQITKDILDIPDIDLYYGDTDTLASIGIDDDWDIPETLPFVVVANKPVFPGCEGEESEEAKAQCFERKLVSYVSSHYKSSELASRLNVFGKVYVSFVIDIDGSINQIEVIKTDDELLNQAAIEAVNSLNEMNTKISPAKNRGKLVKVKYLIPINTRGR